MYLWNTKALAKELKEGTLTEREKFKYYFLSTIVFVLAYELLSYSEFATIEFTIVNLSISLTYVLVIIAGTYLCYEANKQGDGVLFIERIVCLSVPIAIKLCVLLFVLFILAGIFLVILVPEDSYDNASDFIVYLLGGIFFPVALYFKLYNYLKLVSGAESGNNNS